MGLDNARTRVLVLWENHSMLPGRRCETQDVWVPGQEVEFLCKYSESSGFSQGLSSLGYRTTRLGRASDSHRPLGLLLLCSSKHTDPEAVLWGWVTSFSEAQPTQQSAWQVALQVLYSWQYIIACRPEQLHTQEALPLFFLTGRGPNWFECSSPTGSGNVVLS